MYIEEYLKSQRGYGVKKGGGNIINYNSESQSQYSQRFNWQTNPQMNYPFEVKGITKPLRDGTNGNWSNLMNQNSGEKSYRRARSSNSFCNQGESCRVMQPDLQTTPKFKSIKIFGHQENVNDQKRQQERHDVKIEKKWRASVDQYEINKEINRLITDSYVQPTKQELNKKLGNGEINNKSDIFFQKQTDLKARYQKKYFPQKSKIYFQKDFQNENEINQNNKENKSINANLKTSTAVKEALQGVSAEIKSSQPLQAQIQTKNNLPPKQQIQPQRKISLLQEQKIFQSNFQIWENPENNKIWNNLQRETQISKRNSRSYTSQQTNQNSQNQNIDNQPINNNSNLNSSRVSVRKLDVSRVPAKDLSQSKYNYQQQMKSQIF